MQVKFSIRLIQLNFHPCLVEPPGKVQNGIRSHCHALKVSLACIKYTHGFCDSLCYLYEWVGRLSDYLPGS